MQPGGGQGGAARALDSSLGAHQPTWLRCLFLSSSTWQDALNIEPPASAVPQPVIVSEQPLKEGKQTSPPASIPADGFCLCLRCRKQTAALTTSKELYFPT